MTALSFDLAERLQTPIILVTDLDLGMNDHISEPLTWDDSHAYDRGKVLTSQQLDQIYAASGNGNGHNKTQEGLDKFGGKFGRYRDIDDDGITYRTIPATHATHGAFVTRGSSHDEFARYTEDNETYRRYVDRLLKKWETAKQLVPSPMIRNADVVKMNDESKHPSFPAIIYFGTSTYSAEEAIEMLAAEDIHLDTMRVRAFPFGKEFQEFVDSHEQIFVVEQNRDAQFRSLMMIELSANPEKLISVLNYDGMPITADNIYRQIRSNLRK